MSPAQHNTRLHVVRRHSHAVGVSKKILVGVAGCLLLALGYLGFSNDGAEGVRVVLSAAKKAVDNTPITMLKPRYQGVDSNNQPFTIIADDAVKLDDGLIQLKNINADMTLKNATWLALKAKTGMLNETHDRLDLSQDINLFYDGGYEIRTQSAYVDIPTSNVTGNEEVEVQGPAGTIQAVGFSMFDRGKRILFNSNVHVIIYP